MENTEAVQALISIVQGALTQLGIPAVFVLAWWYERRAHQETVRAYTRDLRRSAGLTLPEDIVSSGSGN
jgi:hypothetical protein